MSERLLEIGNVPAKEYYQRALRAAWVEIAMLAPFNVAPSRRPRPGELIEMPWPEQDVRDYRLGIEDNGVDGGVRTLAVQKAGATDGYPVIALHGMPSGRIGVRRVDELRLLGVQYITYDRPGYGCSDRRAGRTVADCVPDIAAIIEAFGLTRCAILGRSGGAPHALACAAYLDQLPCEVDEVMGLVSPAASYAPDEVHLADLGKINSHARLRTPDQMIADKQATVAEIRANPLHMISRLMPDLRPGDHEFFAQLPDVCRLLTSYYCCFTDQYGEQCIYGWYDDERALREPWDFPLDGVDGEKVTLWAGADDAFCPPTQTEWLAEQIELESYYIEDGAAHFSAMDPTPVIDAFLYKHLRKFRTNR